MPTCCEGWIDGLVRWLLAISAIPMYRVCYPGRRAVDVQSHPKRINESSLEEIRECSQAQEG